MANKRQSNGKGRVVTPAPKSANGKSATTPKSASLAIARSVAKRSDANAKNGAKQFFAKSERDPIVIACAHAMTLPTMKSERVPTGKSASDASERRAFAKRIGAKRVSVAVVIHANKNGEITHDRPENTIRARVRSIALAMGKSADYFYAIRTEAFRDGEVPEVWIVRR